MMRVLVHVSARAWAYVISLTSHPCIVFFFFFICKIPKSEVELYGSHMDKAWEIQVVMVTCLIPLAPWQVWQAAEGTGEQVHRRAGWAHLCQPLQHRQLQCQAWQMRNPQGDRETDQTNQRARYRRRPHYTVNNALGSARGPAGLLVSRTVQQMDVWCVMFSPSHRQIVSVCVAQKLNSCD